MGNSHCISQIQIYENHSKSPGEGSGGSRRFYATRAQQPSAGAASRRLHQESEANIDRLKLDIVTIAPLHGFVVPVAELKKLAGVSAGS